jgi:DNA-binding transcriptional LysR family regulator
LSRSRLVLSTRLAQEEMVLVTAPGARPPGIVTDAELSRTPLVLGDGLRAAMDALLAGRSVELNVAIEINDHETIRLMVQQGAAASILPYSSVARECGRGLLDAHRITESGIFRTLALGVPHRLAGARDRGAHDQPARRRVRDGRTAIGRRGSPTGGAPSSTAGGILG